MCRSSASKSASAATVGWEATAGAAAKGATANVATVMADTAATAAADTMATVCYFVSRRQGDGKHDP